VEEAEVRAEEQEDHGLQVEVRVEAEGVHLLLKSLVVVPLSVGLSGS
jgi:hypothetical protein